jgi:hypothetical protein
MDASTQRTLPIEREIFSIRAQGLENLKYASLENDTVRIQRVDDCRCLVTVRTEIDVGDGLRHLATLINLAAEIYEAERRLPFQPTEVLPF